MGISKNIIQKSDITTVPIKVKYPQYLSGSLLENGIFAYDGINGPIPYGVTSNNPYLVYNTIKHLYYKNWITGSLLGTGSAYDSSLQSTAASGSGLDDDRWFPIQTNDLIQVIALPKSLYGERISRNSLSITQSLYNVFLKDDGNGNVVSGSDKVGNILYAQGVIVLTKTNDAYLDDQPGDPASSIDFKFTAESTIYENSVRCRVSENDFNYTLNPSANLAGSTGSYIDAVTGSDFRPYATTVGLYNESNELLVVGKLSTPYPIPSNTDITFVIRWDS
jgi:hypothetical protein